MASAQAKHVTGNLLKEKLFGLLCSSSLVHNYWVCFRITEDLNQFY